MNLWTFGTVYSAGSSLVWGHDIKGLVQTKIIIVELRLEYRQVRRWAVRLGSKQLGEKPSLPLRWGRSRSLRASWWGWGQALLNQPWGVTNDARAQIRLVRDTLTTWRAIINKKIFQVFLLRKSVLEQWEECSDLMTARVSYKSWNIICGVDTEKEMLQESC